MNKKQLILSVLILFLAIPAFAEESTETIKDKVVKSVADTEFADMEAALKIWTDPEMIKNLSNVTLTDNYIKELYAEFKKTVVTPPNPDTYKEYSIENAEKSLVETERLGRKLHNLIQAISDKDFEKYGTFIGTMRDVLFIDARHIPLAIKHDNSRDVYWYELHKKGIEKIEKEYVRLVKNE